MLVINYGANVMFFLLFKTKIFFFLKKNIN